MIAVVWDDVRVAARSLARAPVFAISAVLTLALGIGANTGIFSLLNGLLRPLPVPQGNRIVVLAADFPTDDTGFRHQLSYPELADYRGAKDVFAEVFAFHNEIAGLTVAHKTTPFVFHVVTGNFFSALALSPAAGHFFDPGEGDHPGGEAVVVLGHAYWLRHFLGDPAVIGTSVRLDGQTARIIGVAPASFHGLAYGLEIDGYVPAGSLRGRGEQADRLFTDRSLRLFTVAARLRDGVTLAQAQARAQAIAATLQVRYPDTNARVSARVIPEPLARPTPSRFLAEALPMIYASLFGLAALVLIVACLNVANLLLVRAGARQHELAVRVALGSSRGSLIRLLLAESAILVAGGMAAGLLLARWAADAVLASFAPAIEVPLHLDAEYDWRVFVYVAMVAVAATILIGAVPALRASRAEVANLLQDRHRAAIAGVGRQWLQGLLVVAQIAGSIVLLIVAGLCVRNLQRVQWLSPGFDPEHLLTMRLDPRQLGYDREQSTRFYDEVDRRLRALPGVESVAMSFSVPMGYLLSGCRLTPEGHSVASGADAENIFGCNPVSADYFTTLRIPIARGRAFSAHDLDTSQPVVIINETLARRLWPTEDPIGKRVLFPASPPALRTRTIIGVARDSKYIARFEQPLPFVYVAMKQDPSFMRVVYVRSPLSPDLLITQVQRVIQQLDPDMPISDLKTMPQILDGALTELVFKLATMQATAMALLALLLAMVGLYGVVSYSAIQRTREIGIRVALGAEPHHIASLVLGQGTLLILAGTTVGLVAAVMLTRMIARLFVLVAATDLATFAVVTLSLATIALAACSLPAWRAVRANPLASLRHE